MGIIITIAGLHGVGKSAIAQKIAAHFHLNYSSTGVAFRELAKEQHMSLEEFSHYAENHLEIDRKLDQKIIEIAKSGRNYVLEGQLPAYLTRDLATFSILLTCEESVRLNRMVTRDQRTLSVVKQETLTREQSERERFRQLYQIDILDPSMQLRSFDLILNTTHFSLDLVVQMCIAVLSIYLTNKS